VIVRPGIHLRDEKDLHVLKLAESTARVRET
jgi:hypothetical protein